METVGSGIAFELNDLGGLTPLEGAGRVFSVAGGRAEDGCAVFAGESEGEFVRGEIVEGFVGAEGGPLAAHRGKVDGETDLGEARVGVEAEGGHDRDGVKKAGKEKGVVLVGLESGVGGGLDGEVEVLELGADAVARLTEVEVLPGSLRRGSCCDEAKEEKGEAHAVLLERDRRV